MKLYVFNAVSEDTLLTAPTLNRQEAINEIWKQLGETFHYEPEEIEELKEDFDRQYPNAAQETENETYICWSPDPDDGWTPLRFEITSHNLIEHVAVLESDLLNAVAELNTVQARHAEGRHTSAKYHAKDALHFLKDYVTKDTDNDNAS